MRIPQDAVISDDKLTGYLLVARRRNDKSQFLNQVGFSVEQPHLLDAALRTLISSNEAVLDRQDIYGSFFRVEGHLRGPNGSLHVITIWLEEAASDRYRFITLKPRR